MNALPEPKQIDAAAIEAARKRIAGTITRTPLVKLNVATGGPDIYLKLENLQPINSFKLRGAANAVAMLAPERRALGVWTISAGNAGQGVAYAARQAGVPCTVVTIDTAPATKVSRMEALGARLVKAPFDACWEAMEQRRFPGVEGTFVHPFDDDDFIAGNATMGLEIVEDLPEVETVITAIGGGGLVTGVASGVRARKPGVRVFGAEPETAAPLSRFVGGRQSLGVSAVARDVRRRRRRQERLSAHVGANAAGRRRLRRRDARRDQTRDARARREGARDRRGRRRAFGGRCAQRQGRERGADRCGGLRRKH